MTSKIGHIIVPGMVNVRNTLLPSMHATYNYLKVYSVILFNPLSFVVCLERHVKNRSTAVNVNKNINHTWLKPS